MPEVLIASTKTDFPRRLACSAACNFAPRPGTQGNSRPRCGRDRACVAGASGGDHDLVQAGVSESPRSRVPTETSSLKVRIITESLNVSYRIIRAVVKQAVS